MNALTKNILIVTAGIIINLAVAYFAVRPMISATTNLNQDLISKRNEVASLQQQIRAYQTAQSDLSRATDKQKLKDAILVKENLVTVIKGVELSASRTGTQEEMAITDPFVKKQEGSVKPVIVVKGLSGVTEVPYRLALKNDYTGMIDFLSYLEHLPNLSEITDFQLSADIANGGGGKAVHTGQVLGSVDGVFFVNANATTGN